MTNFMFKRQPNHVGIMSHRRAAAMACGLVLSAFVMILYAPLPTRAASTDFTPQAASSFSAVEYRLGQSDKLRVKVFAWRPSKDEVFEWSALNGEYAVGPSGTVSVPLIGDTFAGGMTTAELGRSIGLKLKERIGLAESPEVSVEVTQYRPFYIVGNVEKPGEYAFRPQLTVLQATSIAGGQSRARDAMSMRMERELIVASGDVEQLQSEKASLVAKRMRLIAEMSDAPSIEEATVISFDQNTSVQRAAIAQESRIFEVRKSALTAQREALSQLIAYLENELISQQAQLKGRNDEVKLVRDELNSVRDLVRKKLAIETRRIGLERNLTQVEGERLRMESSVMRVKQDISKAKMSLLDLQNNRMQEVIAELALTETRLDQLTGRLRTAERLLADSRAAAPGVIVSDRKPVITYKIIRQHNGLAVELAATESSAVEPGDTVKMEVQENTSTAPPAPKSAPYERALPPQAFTSRL